MSTHGGEVDLENETEVPITDVIFETSDPVMFSPLASTMTGITFKWKSWKHRVISIKKNGIVHYRKNIRDKTFKEIFKLGKVKLVELDNNIETEDERENGIVVHCQTMAGFDTMFRCIFNEAEMDAFKKAVISVANVYNSEEEMRGSITSDVKQSINANSTKQVIPSKVSKSVMRRAVARAMDRQDKRSLEDKIRSRRGAMHWLPVLFMSDLVHGSW